MRFALAINVPKCEVNEVRTLDGNLIVKFEPYIAEMRISARGCTKAQYAEKILKYSIAGTTATFEDANTLVISRIKREEIKAPKSDTYMNNLTRIDYSKPTIQYDGEPVEHTYPKRAVRTAFKDPMFVDHPKAHGYQTDGVVASWTPNISLKGRDPDPIKTFKLISMGMRNGNESRYHVGKPMTETDMRKEAEEHVRLATEREATRLAVRDAYRKMKGYI